MNAISRWANQHRQLAILLLITCEVANAANGLLLGANALAHWSVGLLLLATLMLLGFGIWVRWRAKAHPPRTYAASRWQLAGAFGSTYLLFVLLGGQLDQSVSYPSGDRVGPRSVGPHSVGPHSVGLRSVGLRSVTFGSSQVVVRADTLIAPEKPTTGLSGTAVSPVADPAPVNQSGRRFGYIMLFVLGLVLLFSSIVLSCGLACSGYGFVAVLVLLLGLGAWAGGTFFLARSSDKPIRRWRDTPKTDRKRTMRRFWRALLVLFGIILLIVIL